VYVISTRSHPGISIGGHVREPDQEAVAPEPSALIEGTLEPLEPTASGPRTRSFRCTSLPGQRLVTSARAPTVVIRILCE
jgi:hypothetical protein